MSSFLRTPDMPLQIFPLPQGQEDVDSLSQKIDDLLSKELQSLSIQQRTKVQEEVHGVANLCPTENPAMIEEGLKSMQQHLDAIQDKHVYDQLSPLSYLHTREWRLRFLRCELHDSKMAAERLVRFTEYMHQEYDLEVLERPLRLSDLETKCGPNGKEVMNSFKSGHTQLLPFRDRSGRRVITLHVLSKTFETETRVSSPFRMVFVLFYSSWQTNQRAFSIATLRQFKISQYLWLVASEDEETQRNGIVIVLWGIGEGIQYPDPSDLTSELPTIMSVYGT
jgi:hypothetical protein